MATGQLCNHRSSYSDSVVWGRKVPCQQLHNPIICHIHATLVNESRSVQELAT